jgi:hypothetical protein
MYRWKLVLMAILMSLPGSLSARTPQIASGAAKNSDTVLHIFDELGNQYDRFFTVEEAWTETEPMNLLKDGMVQRPKPTGNVFRDLDQLRKLIPDFTYYADKRNPRIIHVSDSRVAQQKGYGLDQVVKEINFEGLAFDLVNVIGQQGIRVSSRGPIDTTEMLFLDLVTRVHVKGKRLTVRDALSNSIPLEGRSSRILWIAETKLGIGEITYVRFRGVVRQRRANH